MSVLSYVHTTQGTDSSPRFSAGNTLPLTQLPFGMTSFLPQTQSSGCFYQPSHRWLEGVRLTHQPSPWVGDFGSLILMPQSGKPETEAERRWSGYSPRKAVLQPHYLKVDFLRSMAAFELTPTERGAAIRLKFDENGDTPFLSVIQTDGSSSFSLDVANRKLIGYTTSHTHAVPDNYRMYFVLEFDSPILSEQCISNEQAIHIALGRNKVEVKMAISFISQQQAMLNLHSELYGQTFDELHQAAMERWEHLLGRVIIETPDTEKMQTFYSCLYRTFLYPNKLYEYDASGMPWHYCSYDGEIKQGIIYTNNGFWDTFRTVYPLLSLVAPDILSEVLTGYIQIYKDTGWLPKWPSLSETGYMPGTMIDAVIADAAVKGILKEPDLRVAFEGMLKHSEQAGEGVYGREAVQEYIRFGYVPREVCKESVNKTLDYAYGDFCIARVAALLGETKIAACYDKRAQNYRNIFDPQTGFMRGRDKDGQMAEPFDEFGWGGEYTEGGPWQNSFAVYHDIDGLAELYGGKEKLIKKLDELFATPPVYHVGGYGVEIHEMTEMAAVDFGQCAISNQPSFHIPYLYAALGQPEKTAYWVKRMTDEVFSYRPDGFPGDEDNGATSAWYIFSCMGLYPICPGKAEYVCSEPLVDRVFINGNKIDIHKFYGKFIRHDELVTRP